MSHPKTFDGLKSALRKLVGNNANISINVYYYDSVTDHGSGTHTWVSEDWICIVKFDEEKAEPLFRGIHVTVNDGTSPADCLRKVKQAIRDELSRRRSARSLEVTRRDVQQKRLAKHQFLLEES